METTNHANPHECQVPDDYVEEFVPLYLSVDRVEPFQSRMEEFDFTDTNNEPCNVYLMVSKNGRGKTTVMEMLAAMVGMLGKTECTSLGFEASDREYGRAQWDLRVTLRQDGRRETMILSLLAGFMGEEVPLKLWGESDCKKFGASGWCRFGFVRNAFGRYSMVGRGNTWVQDFNLLNTDHHRYPLVRLRKRCAELSDPDLFLRLSKYHSDTRRR